MVMAREDPARGQPLSLEEQVALAVRYGRSKAGVSQRALAEALGCSQSTVSRLEGRAGGLNLETVGTAVEHAGFQLVVALGGVRVPDYAWEPTELLARDRAGRRFPAQRTVYPSPEGPYWWWEQEFLRLSRPLGPRPQWTTVVRDMFGKRDDR